MLVPPISLWFETEHSMMKIISWVRDIAPYSSRHRPLFAPHSQNKSPVKLQSITELVASKDLH